jgi:phage terminase large subunit
MTKNDVSTTKVFKENLLAYQNGEDLIINEGGTRSSKSYSILQLLYFIAKASTEPLIISIVSRTFPHLRLGVMRDFEKILLSVGEIPDAIRVAANYKIGVSIIEFFGADQLDKVHGPARHILFINEANYLKQDVYDHLSVRTTRTIFIDYNPTRTFWIHTEVIPNNKHKLIRSTYKDNDNLSAVQIMRIEAKKKNEQWWRVYGLGLIGQLEDAIFTNWKSGKFDDSLPSAYGLDFGSKHHDAMVKVAVDYREKKLYWKQELYETGLSTNQLGSRILSLKTGDKLIIADSASPRSIQDLKALGLNITAVTKGRVVDDIKMIWDWELIIDPESFDLEKELQNWVWLDKRGEIPIDEDDDLLDAARYISRTLIKPKSTDSGHRPLTLTRR